MLFLERPYKWDGSEKKTTPGYPMVAIEVSLPDGNQLPLAWRPIPAFGPPPPDPRYRMLRGLGRILGRITRRRRLRWRLLGASP